MQEKYLASIIPRSLPTFKAGGQGKSLRDLCNSYIVHSACLHAWITEYLNVHQLHYSLAFSVARHFLGAGGGSGQLVNAHAHLQRAKSGLARAVWFL